MNPDVLMIVSAGVLLFALFSKLGSTGSVTGPMVFTAFGLVVGAAGFGLIDVALDDIGLEFLAGSTLALALFTDAARIDVRRLDAEHDLPLRLLCIGMPLTMILGALVAWALFPGLGFWPALVLGVILAPTDAALGQAVVTNQDVPPRIRQALNVESGLNDGLAFPVLLIVLSVAVEAQAGRGAAEWGLFTLSQVGLGPLAGIAVGLVGARAVEYCAGRGWMDHAFLQISVLSLAAIAYTGAEAIGGNGFIAAFAAGMVVGTRSRRLLEAVEDFGEAEGQLLNLIVFLLFGAVLLPTVLADIGWRHLVYGILSLTIIRMAPVALSLAGARLAPSTVAFIGWFGPRGLASILYLLLILDSESLAGMSDIAAATLVTVALSVLLHGATASPLARAYARRLSARAPAAPEHRPALPFRTRFRTPDA